MHTHRDRYTFENESKVAPAILRPIKTFYVNWDKTDDSTHAYLKAFTSNATFELQPFKMTGHEEIKGMRNRIIHHTNGPVTRIQHTLLRVYIMGGHESSTGRKNVAVTAEIKYTMRGGKVVNQVFTTTFDLVVVGNEYKIQSKTVYTDNTKMMAAIKEAAAV